MFTDNTLTPKEAVRLCALGILAAGPSRYDVLASAVRHFVSHIIGPSLDVMGQSIELLKYEGLVLVSDADAGNSDLQGTPKDAELTITDRGKRELHTLLTANIRHGATELNKLVVALKFHFFHTLSAEDQVRQIEMLSDMCENELARLENLRERHAGDDGLLGSWLSHDIDQMVSRQAWLRQLRDRIQGQGTV